MKKRVLARVFVGQQRINGFAQVKGCFEFDCDGDNDNDNDSDNGSGGGKF